MAKRNIEPIVGVQILLRMLDESDLPMTLEWRNQNHVRKWFFTTDIISNDQHRRWFERYKELADDFVFVIEQLLPHRPIGQVALYNVDWIAKRAEFGRLMIGVAEVTRQGFGTAATDLLVTEALTHWGLDEVYLEVLVDNAPARSVYARCGFVEAGQHANIMVMRRTKSRGIHNS